MDHVESLPFADTPAPGYNDIGFLQVQVLRGGLNNLDGLGFQVLHRVGVGDIRHFGRRFPVGFRIKKHRRQKQDDGGRLDVER